ncbi:hypothetical protein NPX99_02940 [Bartonella sp. 220]|uniref:POTRA domain-containing protein n=1 Tax=Bartonella sp. 220B TaxID=2967260 RepID=UPI0022A91556|nr:POTRA domain-containing protein [Bartonella sp. 220B]MCZ2158244.1 hypothetical protein [Bartonella sp. 220B]
MALSFIALPGFAANIRDQAIDQSESIQRQQTQQRRFQEWHKRTGKPEVFFEDNEESSSDDAPRSKTCVMIKSIALIGARLISYRDLHGSISRWEGRCLGIEDINKALKAVTMLYVKRGYYQYLYFSLKRAFEGYLKASS